MIRVLFWLALVCTCYIDGFAQEKRDRVVSPYGDIAFSAQAWPGSIATIGVQGTAGIVINNKFSIGAGYSVGSRNYEYRMIPFEVGYLFLDGVCSVRLYAGATQGAYFRASGSLWGSELVFRPRFDARKLRLFLALGVAFDKSEGETNYSPDPSKTDRVAGPRLRIGMGL